MTEERKEMLAEMLMWMCRNAVCPMSVYQEEPCPHGHHDCRETTSQHWLNWMEDINWEDDDV